MTSPRNCRFCLNCNEYDEGQFYCNHYEKCMNKAQASAYRNCLDYYETAIAADDTEGIWGTIEEDMRRKKELELYEKRMRGDWS